MILCESCFSGVASMTGLRGIWHVYAVHVSNGLVSGHRRVVRFFLVRVFMFFVVFVVHVTSGKIGLFCLGQFARIVAALCGVSLWLLVLPGTALLVRCLFSKESVASSALPLGVFFTAAFSSEVGFGLSSLLTLSPGADYVF